MTGNDTILTTLAALLVVASAFACGALYQWYRHALERHDAWRDGYDQASGTMFKLAARFTRRRPGESTMDIITAVQEKQPAATTQIAVPVPPVTGTATVTAITDAPSHGARHSFELRYERTRRMVIAANSDDAPGSAEAL